MKYLFAGGGTGGHLFPGLALAQELESKDPAAEIIFVGTNHGLDKDIVGPTGYKLEIISAGRGSPLSIKAPLNLPRFGIAIWQSAMLIRRFRPDVVVALGGFAAAAPGLAARFLKVPLVILEQNTVPGRVNRMLSGWAREIHLQFDEARKYFNSPAEIKFSGSPLRKEALDMFGEGEGESRKKDALLIVGGSQGAQRLNDISVKSAVIISRKTGCPVIHVAGAANEEKVRVEYAAAGVDAEVFGFTDRLLELISRAKIAITRAGAMSIAELSLAGVPCVFVPLPSAMDDHQRFNAESVARSGGAVVLSQDTLDSDRLADEVLELLDTPSKLAEMSEKIKTVAMPKAGGDIAESILKLIGKE
ncbi:MAG: undecaprenyldiphospho-muramoylpentapeptide beta-N-acetylglucosaminyltransferase [Planctomycetes bacterium]|nr:undecaprenyldiphospho-muramoylpentapeptide beta-N-acetylglucosaminyltransferase [Planctomycetota bacterium]